ncbi:MAG: hypothetical protein DWH97_12895 [Planctomycetota bacterium]|nr:MAG: hypothetical protein DWH97_12895 [Planctomycetota bacterium]
MQIAPTLLVPEFVVSPAFSYENHRVFARRCAHGCALALSSALVLLVLGCGSTGYVTPGGGAPLGSLISQPIAQQLQLVPESPMPAGLAFTRVQAVGYRSYSASGTNRGSLSLVGPQDLERDQDRTAIAAWPNLRNLVRLTPIMVPTDVDALNALRQAAASLRTDILALYTVDTDFNVDDGDVGLVGMITLGLAPTRKAVVRCNVSIVFLDVRTGYCYGSAEAAEDDRQLANAWTSRQAVEDCRHRVERRAFEAMLVRAAEMWGEITQSRIAAIEAAASAPRVDPVVAPIVAPDVMPDVAPSAESAQIETAK